MSTRPVWGQHGKMSLMHFAYRWFPVLLLIASVLAGCDGKPASGDERIILKAGHALDTSHPIHRALLFMAERLQEKSGGKVELRIYPSSQLGDTRVMLEQAQLGVLTFVPASTANMEGFVPVLGAFSVPYLFRDRAHFWEVLDGPIGQDLNVSCEQAGLRGMCFFDSGARSFYTKKTPVLDPGDLKGMKIRVQANETSLAMVSALGGSPTPIPWGELYTALQQGVVDGAENNTPSFLSSRHFEVCPVYSLDEHTRIPDMLLMSLKKWNAYPSEIQNLIAEAARETSLYQRELWQRMTIESLETLKENGVEIHHPDKAPFQAKVRAMHERYAGTEVGDLIQAVKHHGGNE